MLQMSPPPQPLTLPSSKSSPGLGTSPPRQSSCPRLPRESTVCATPEPSMPPSSQPPPHPPFGSAFPSPSSLTLFHLHLHRHVAFHGRFGIKSDFYVIIAPNLELYWRSQKILGVPLPLLMLRTPAWVGGGESRCRQSCCTPTHLW